MDSPLKTWLESNALSQAELAHAAQCSQGLVSNVVHGVRKPSGKLRAFLPKALSIACDSFVDSYGEELRQKLGRAA